MTSEKKSAASYKLSYKLLCLFVILLFFYCIPYVFNNPFGMKRNWHYQERNTSLPVRCYDEIIFARQNEQEDIVIHCLKNKNNVWQQFQEFIPNNFESCNLEAIHFNEQWLVLVARNTLSTWPLRFLINTGAESQLYYVDQSKERWDTIHYFIYEKKNSLWEYSQTIATMRKDDKKFCSLHLTDDVHFFKEVKPSSKNIETSAEKLSNSGDKTKNSSPSSSSPSPNSPSSSFPSQEKELYFSFDSKGKISGLIESCPNESEKKEIYRIP